MEDDALFEQQEILQQQIDSQNKSLQAINNRLNDLTDTLLIWLARQENIPTRNIMIKKLVKQKSVNLSRSKENSRIQAEVEEKLNRETPISEDDTVTAEENSIAGINAENSISECEDEGGTESKAEENDVVIISSDLRGLSFDNGVLLHYKAHSTNHILMPNTFHLKKNEEDEYEKPLRKYYSSDLKGFFDQNRREDMEPKLFDKTPLKSIIEPFDRGRRLLHIFLSGLKHSFNSSFTICEERKFRESATSQEWFPGMKYGFSYFCWIFEKETNLRGKIFVTRLLLYEMLLRVVFEPFDRGRKTSDVFPTFTSSKIRNE